MVADEPITKRQVLGRLALDPLTQDFVKHEPNSQKRQLIKPLFEVIAIHRFYDAISAALNLSEGTIPHADNVIAPASHKSCDNIPVLAGNKHLERVSSCYR